VQGMDDSALGEQGSERSCVGGEFDWKAGRRK
jgi:hypothetical protein